MKRIRFLIITVIDNLSPVCGKGFYYTYDRAVELFEGRNNLLKIIRGESYYWKAEVFYEEDYE